MQPLRSYIAHDDIDRLFPALEERIPATEQRLNDELHLYQNQWEQNERSRRSGQVSEENYQVVRNRIVGGLQSLIGRVEAKNTLKAKPASRAKGVPGWFPYLIIGILLLGGVIFLLKTQPTLKNPPVEIAQEETTPGASTPTPTDNAATLPESEAQKTPASGEVPAKPPTVKPERKEPARRYFSRDKADLGIAYRLSGVPDPGMALQLGQALRDEGQVSAFATAEPAFYREVFNQGLLRGGLPSLPDKSNVGKLLLIIAQGESKTEKGDDGGNEFAREVAKTTMSTTVKILLFSTETERLSWQYSGVVRVEGEDKDLLQLEVIKQLNKVIRQKGF